MRNLKRALSLALASIMVLGMMVIGAGAASYDKFSDKEDIVYKDAVSMVTELGIIAGLPDGSYGPTQNIDRASFARLICVALNGGKEPLLGANLKTSFSDTQGNWAESYIAYCVDRGIVAGKGNNTFAPSANVTGSEAAKMLLVALGYNAENEGIGGATWQITTDVLANQAGLYDDLAAMNTSESLTRDQAAQMIYNVLNAETVTYSYSYTPTGVTAVLTKTGMTMLEDKFGVITVEGIVLANEYADLGNGGDALKEGKTSLKITNGGADEDQNNYTGTKTFNVSSDASVLGRAVTMYVKPSSTASSASDKATVVGSVLVSSSNNVVVDASRDTLKEVASDNKVTLKTDGDTKVAKNYAGLNSLASADLTADGVRGEVRTLVDNDDDSVVDYVIYETEALGKVTKYSTKDDGSITINGTSSLAFDDQEDVVGFEDVAKGDYVLYAVIGGKLYVEKAESITGELDAYTSGKNLTVDGEKINTSDLAFYSDGNTLIGANVYDNLDKTATFYKDSQGNIIAVDGTAASNNYAFLIKAASKGGVSDDVEVKVVLDDGTVGTYILDTDNDDTDVVAGDKNLLCTYTLSDDTIVLSKASSTEKSNTNITIKKGNATITGISGNYADSSTVYFYVSPKGTYVSQAIADLTVDETNVYVGKDSAAGLTYASDDKTDFLYVTKDGDIKAVLVVTDSVGSSSDYLYLYQKQGRNSDGYLYNAIIDGELVKNIVVTSSVGLGLYPYTTTTKGYYKVGSAIDASGNIDRLDGNSVIIGGTEYKLTSSTTIANIDGSDTAVDAVINEGDFVVFKANTDKDLEAVYVTLPYDASKTEITVDADAATTANIAVEISGDVVTISGTDRATTTGTELLSCLNSDDAAVKVVNAAGTAVTGGNVVSGDLVIATYTDDDGNTLVDTYTITVKA